MEEGMVSDLFIKNIYAVQRNNYGHAIFIMKEIFPGKISKEGQELFIKHVVDTVKESLAISKKFTFLCLFLRSLVKYYAIHLMILLKIYIFILNLKHLQEFGA